MSSFNWPSLVSGGGVPTYTNLAAFPAASSAGNGALGIALDTNIVYESDGTSWLVVGGPADMLAVGTIDSVTPTANGASDANNQLIMQSASATVPGVVNLTTQTFSGAKAYNSTVSMLNYIPNNTTIVSSATPVVLTATSTRIQTVTGSADQVITLPDVSTLALGTAFEIYCNSTGGTFVQTSNSTGILAMTDGTRLIVTSAATSGASTAVWYYDYENVTSIPLAVYAGGTGTVTEPTPGGVIYGESSTVYASTAAGTTGQLLTSNAGSAPSWTNPVPFNFGDASDGDVVLDGTNTFSWATLVGSVYTLQRQVYAGTMTINSGVTLITTGFSIRAITLNNAGTIQTNGNNGTAGGLSGQGSFGPGGAVTASTSVWSNDLGFSPFGGDGCTGDTGPGTDGGTDLGGQATLTNGFFTSGNGGAGGTGTSGSGGITAPGVGPIDFINLRVLTDQFLRAHITNIPILIEGNSGGSGGSAGSGDGVNNGGGGGGGGGGASVLALYIQTLNNTGLIEALGGNGGNGETPTVTIGGCGGGGGGGGGCGGFIYLVTQTTVAAGTVSAAGGTFGTGGAGAGTGGAGSNGTVGDTGLILHFQTSTNTWL